MPKEKDKTATGNYLLELNIAGVTSFDYVVEFIMKDPCNDHFNFKKEKITKDPFGTHRVIIST